MKCRLIIFLATLLYAGTAWGQASQITDSYLHLGRTKSSNAIMAMRCDNSGGIATAGAIGGETCESGDWSKRLDHHTQRIWLDLCIHVLWLPLAPESQGRLALSVGQGET